MKNIVFIPNIDLGNGRSDNYSYCIKSWKYWCDKTDCELLLLEDLLLPVEQMRITWQRYYVFDVLDNSNIDYNQVLVVDADTIVHPECPNFFNETDGKYAAVMNDGDYEWVNKSISQYGVKFFDKDSFPTWRYVNGGFQIQDLFEQIDIAEEFCRGAAIKYLIRFGKKSGKNNLDLLKCMHYIVLMYHYCGFDKELLVENQNKT